jgi:hypothetical protein
MVCFLPDSLSHTLLARPLSCANAFLIHWHALVRGGLASNVLLKHLCVCCSCPGPGDTLRLELPVRKYRFHKFSPLNMEAVVYNTQHLTTR